MVAEEAKERNGADSDEPETEGGTGPAPAPQGDRVVVRVFWPGNPKSQLRPGEQGISVFEPAAVSPPLTDNEVLAAFRPGSQVTARTVAEIEMRGLRVAVTPGGPMLPPRLQVAHAEIVPGPGMTRNQFKLALKGLE